MTAVTPSISVEDTGRPSRARSSAARGLAALRFASGTVTAGLLALAAVVGASAAMAGDRPGPGIGAVAGHAAAAVAALALQVFADRRRGVLAVPAALLVFPLAAAVLWFWWWN